MTIREEAGNAHQEKKCREVISLKNAKEPERRKEMQRNRGEHREDDDKECAKERVRRTRIGERRFRLCRRHFAEKRWSKNGQAEDAKQAAERRMISRERCGRACAEQLGAPGTN